MRNVIIMDAERIGNKRYRDNFGLQLVDFDMEHMQSDIMPRKTVEMCDVFIVTDRNNFKILKCRVPNLPSRQAILPLSYLPHTLTLIQEWQES